MSFMTWDEIPLLMYMYLGLAIHVEMTKKSTASIAYFNQFLIIRIPKESSWRNSHCCSISTRSLPFELLLSWLVNIFKVVVLQLGEACTNACSITPTRVIKKLLCETEDMQNISIVKRSHQLGAL